MPFSIKTVVFSVLALLSLVPPLPILAFVCNFVSGYSISISRRDFCVRTRAFEFECAEASIEVEDAGGDGAQPNPKYPYNIRISRIEHGKKMSGYDVSTARGWMEHIEQLDGPIFGVGAYSVIRCDSICGKHGCHWNMWGVDFHMNRLWLSYAMLMGNCSRSFKSSTGETHPIFEPLKSQTQDVISRLLQEAKRTNHVNEEKSNEDLAKDIAEVKFTQTLMVTILWTPPKHAGGIPTVRAHATFSGTARALDEKDSLFPFPISACLAIPIEPTADSMAKLPRRLSCERSGDAAALDGASAKLSSWCRIRRPLEDPTRYKIPGTGVGEVILVSQEKKGFSNDQQDFIDSLEILEGLTSNVFVVYKDGTVRTAPIGKVLSGYARHLVVQIINEGRLNKALLPYENPSLDEMNAPTIHDAKKGLWSEVFITSAIRLVVPVIRVLIPTAGNAGVTTIWRSNNHDQNSAHPLAFSILSEIHEIGPNQ